MPLGGGPAAGALICSHLSVFNCGGSEGVGSSRHSRLPLLAQALAGLEAVEEATAGAPPNARGPSRESQRGAQGCTYWWGTWAGAASGIGARTHDYGSGTIPCAPRGNFARVSSGMFRCAETSLGGRWLSQLASETSS